MRSKKIRVVALVVFLTLLFLYLQISFFAHDRGTKLMVQKLDVRDNAEIEDNFNDKNGSGTENVVPDLHSPIKPLLATKTNSPTLPVQHYTLPVGNKSQVALSYQSFLNKPSNDLSGMEPAWRYNAMIYKKENLKKRFLTIAIPTVKRKKGDYLIKTLDSILQNTDNRNDVYIVVFLADFDKEWRVNMSSTLYKLYTSSVNDGTLQIIEAPRSFYPPLNNLQHTYNDSVLKRKWRSKQNVDYAFSILYSLNLATYYMQLEDDIYTVPGYLNAIKIFIDSMKHPWVCLEFSTLGFIGKLFPSQYIEKLAKMLLLFYEEQPCDEIVPFFIKVMLQTRRYIRKPSIFQHIGLFSSLPGKIQPLKDPTFELEPKKYKGDNPPAKIHTNMPTNEKFTPELAYSLQKGFFWSSRNGKWGDYYTILFDKPQYLDRVVIETGMISGTDKIEKGVVKMGSRPVYLPFLSSKCANDIHVGELENGQLDIHLQISHKIYCIEISVTKDQSWWVIIREIAVFIKK